MIIDPRENVWPLVPPGKNNAEMMEGAPNRAVPLTWETLAIIGPMTAGTAYAPATCGRAWLTA